MLEWFGAVAGPEEADVPTKARGDGPMRDRKRVKRMGVLAAKDMCWR